MRHILSIAVLAALLSACASEPPALGKDEMIQKLGAAGLQVELQEKTLLYPDQLKKFTTEPLASFSMRVSDAQGSEPVTAVDFGKASVALKQEGQKLNGFAHKNWFFAGIISNQTRDKIKAALP